MAGGFHDSVSKLWVVRTERRALDVDGFDDEVEAIGALIRHALVRNGGDTNTLKARVRAAVDKALMHMDEDSDRRSEGE